MDLPRERVKMIADGRITIPKRFREHLGVKEGSILEVSLYKGKLHRSIVKSREEKTYRIA